jgi:hypothetical protein
VAPPTGVQLAIGGDPIVGVKYAQLVAAAAGLSFAPAFPRMASQPYSAVARAVCENDHLDHAHVAPALRCHCGFHAVATTRELWRVAPAIGGVVLDVELAGIVVEHQRGWRASHQAVLGVRLPARCSRLLCRRPTAGVAPYRVARGSIEPWPWTPMRPVCARCMQRRGVPLAEVASALGVEVTIEGREDRTARADARAGPESRSLWLTISEHLACCAMFPTSAAMLAARSSRLGP